MPVLRSLEIVLCLLLYTCRSYGPVFAAERETSATRRPRRWNTNWTRPALWLQVMFGSRACAKIELLIMMIIEPPTASDWNNGNIVRRGITEIVPILREDAPASLDGPILIPAHVNPSYQIGLSSPQPHPRSRRIRIAGGVRNARRPLRNSGCVHPHRLCRIQGTQLIEDCGRQDGVRSLRPTPSQWKLSNSHGAQDFAQRKSSVSAVPERGGRTKVRVGSSGMADTLSLN